MVAAIRCECEGEAPASAAQDISERVIAELHVIPILEDLPLDQLAVDANPIDAVQILDCRYRSDGGDLTVMSADDF